MIVTHHELLLEQCSDLSALVQWYSMHGQRTLMILALTDVW